MANLLFSKDSVTTDTSSGSFTLIDEMTSGAVAVVGTASVILLIFHITPDDTTADESAKYRFTVDGSAVGSPVMATFMDNTLEGNGTTMVWAVDGLSTGNHTFTVEWITVAGTPETATDRNRSFQVIEFDTDATLKIDKVSTSSQIAPATWANMTDMSGTFTTAAGASHLILTSFAPKDASDDTADLQFAIGGTREGPASCSWNDKIDQHVGTGMMYFKTGLSAISREFSLQWQIRISGPSTNVVDNRTFQVIEFTDNFALVNHAAAGSTSAQDDPATFTNMDEMTATVTPDSTDSVLLVIACGVMGAPVITDNTVEFMIADDGVREGATIWTFSDKVDAAQGFLLARAKTGETAETVWSLQWKDVTAPSITDTARERWFQVIDFKKAGGGSTTQKSISVTFTTTMATTTAKIVVQAINIGFVTAMANTRIKIGVKTISVAFVNAISVVKKTTPTAKAVNFVTTMVTTPAKTILQAINVAFVTTMSATAVQVILRAFNVTFTTAMSMTSVTTFARAFNVAFGTTMSLAKTVKKNIAVAFGTAFANVRKTSVTKAVAFVTAFALTTVSLFFKALSVSFVTSMSLAKKILKTITVGFSTGFTVLKKTLVTKPVSFVTSMALTAKGEFFVSKAVSFVTTMVTNATQVILKALTVGFVTTFSIATQFIAGVGPAITGGILVFMRRRRWGRRNRK